LTNSDNFFGITKEKRHTLIQSLATRLVSTN